MISRGRMSIRWAFNFRAWSPCQEEWTLCNQCVQSEESSRIKQFVFKKDAKASMIGRLMLRKAVSEYLQIPYNDIVLARTDKGKPYLDDRSNKFSHFNFNVSHSGDYTILAADGRHCSLGADIMKFDDRTDVKDFFHTMRRQFTEKEWQVIKSPRKESEQLKLFFRLWCLKESYVKALGIGIGFEIQRLNFDLQTPTLNAGVVTDTVLKVDGAWMKHWLFEEQIIDNHCVAVATDCKKKSFLETPISMDSKFISEDGTFILLTFNDLVKNAVPLFEPNSAFWDNFHPKKETPGLPKA